MAITFQLPTFQVEVQPYIFNPADGTYTAGDPLIGQVYTPLRNSDDESGGLLYFMYPKENDVLHDRYDYNSAGAADVLVIEFPTGSGIVRGYRVRDVMPRWLQFVNEHLMVSLERLSVAATDLVIGGGGGVSVWEGNFTEHFALPVDAGAQWGFVGDNIAEVELTEALPASNVLFLHTPSFPLPSGANIIGIEKTLYFGEVGVVIYGNSYIQSMTWWKLSNGFQSSDFGGDEIFPDPEVNMTFGDPASTLGLSMTAAEFNSGDIALAIAAEHPGTPGEEPSLRIQHDVGLKVYYTI